MRPPVACAALLAAALAAGLIRAERPGALPPARIPAPQAPLPLPEVLRAERPLGLVLVSIDTLRADRLSLYGHERSTSPALDAFAREARVFESAWSQSPKTAESHMTLFTGLYPAAHGVENLRHRSQALAPAIPTLAEILQRAGYRTAGFHGAGNLDAELGFDRGFDLYEHPGDVEAVFARGIEWLERRAREPERRPFYLFLHTKVLHDPYEPPPEYAALFADPDYAGRIGLPEAERLRARREGGWWLVHRRYWERVDPASEADVQHLRDLYDALIRYMDDRLALLLDRFLALGLDRDTLFVFLSDHGEEFMDHRGFRHGSLHREVLHVPLLVRLPDAAGRRIREPVALVDVLPTLLEWLGLPRPAHLQGRSFAALLRDEPLEERPVYSEWAARGARSLRSGSWSYLDARVGERLYDLASDPAERRDLAGREPERLLRLRRDAGALSRATADFAAGVGRGQRFDLDAGRRAQLEALGYLGGNAP